MTNKREEDSRSGYSSNVHSPNTPMMTMINSREKKTVGSRTTSAIPFHIPTIPKPQDEFNIFVNNTNQPFEHVWLQRTEDGSRFIHPMEKHSWFDFIDYNDGLTEPVKPLPLENTPFKLVEEVKELKILSAKLSVVDEFAVDLEHNQYRSFQGLTCLMQISTRTEDFVIDTLKLRVHVGPYLREVFKDPSKRKVMHGADRDIVWLQRDFGIYICNLFDTQQASKLLNLERNSLEYLLLYFCGITVNKAYQNADWRLRPLPDDMLKYAREDTHYLLYIYDLMRRRLLSSPAGPSGINPLLEAYENTYAICTQLYEKELLTSTSYLYIYGLQEADFNSQQLSVVSGLSEWRDAVARAEDESTGYILPNKTLLEIARQMPLTVGKLRRLVKSHHPYVDVNLDSIVAIIKSSIQNASAFESTVQLLKMRRQGIEIEPNTELASTFSCQQGNTDDGSTDRVNGQTTWCLSASVPFKSEYPRLQQEISESSRRSQSSTFQPSGRYVEPRKEQDNRTVDLPREDLIKLRQLRGTHTDTWNSNSAKAFSGAAVQVADKPCNLSEVGTLALKAKCKIDPEVTKKKIEVASPVSQLGIGDGVSLANGKTKESLPAFVHINGEVQCAQRKEVGSSICCQRERIVEAINEVNWQTSLSVSPSLHVNEESVAEHIMEETSTVSSEQETVGQDEGVGRVNWPIMKHSSSSVSFKEEYTKLEPDIIESCSSQGSSLQPSNFVEETMACQRLNLLEESSDVFGQKRGTYTNKEKSYLAKNFSEATEEVLNKPIYNFGWRASIPKSEFDSNSKGESEQIESRAISPFQSSTSSNEELMSISVNTNKEILSSEYSFAMPTGAAKSETTSSLGTHLADLEPLHSAPVALTNNFESKEDKNNLGNISVPCLSSNFQNDIQYTKGQEKSGHTEKAQELDLWMALGVDKGLKSLLNIRKGCNSSLLSRIREDELTKDFQKGKQYQTYHTVND